MAGDSNAGLEWGTVGRPRGHSGVVRAQGGPRLELPLGLLSPPLLRTLRITHPHHPCLTPSRRCSCAQPLPLPPSDAPLKSYLSSCSLFPPGPGIICLLPPTHPPPASHLGPLPPPYPLPPTPTPPRLLPVPSCRPAPALLASPGGISELWVGTLPAASCKP